MLLSKYVVISDVFVYADEVVLRGCSKSPLNTRVSLVVPNEAASKINDTLSLANDRVVLI